MGNHLQCYGPGRLSADFTGPEEFIMVMRPDGKVMEFTAPLLVGDLMAAYPQHSVVHSEDAACRSVSPENKLVPGQLYRLLFIPKSPSLSKNVVLSEAKSIYNSSLERRIGREKLASTRPPPSRKSAQNGSGIIRVKMVITKRELEAMLSDRCIKEKSLLFHLERKTQNIKENYVATRRCSNDGWRPSLESILEVN